MIERPRTVVARVASAARARYALSCWNRLMYDEPECELVSTPGGGNIFYCRPDQGSFYVIAWAAGRLVATTYRLGEDDEPPGGQLGLAIGIRDPSRVLKDAPAALRPLIAQVVEYPPSQRLASSGYWLSEGGSEWPSEDWVHGGLDMLGTHLWTLDEGVVDQESQRRSGFGVLPLSFPDAAKSLAALVSAAEEGPQPVSRGLEEALLPEVDWLRQALQALPDLSARAANAVARLRTLSIHWTSLHARVREIASV